MKKSKLKKKIKKLEAQVLEARASAIASSIAKMIVGGIDVHTEPEAIGALRRAAVAAGKPKP